MKLLLDGNVVAYGGPELTSNSALYVPMSFSTDDFANGSHTLEATDSLGNTDIRTVTFNNPMTSITDDATFDITPGTTDVPTSCHITATLPTTQAWTVTIQTTDNTPVVVRTYSGNSSSIDATWDGKNSSGTEADDDVYEAVLATAGQTRSRKVNKNRIGDCFLIFETDKSIFPNGIGSFRSYKNFIVGYIKPYLGIDFNKISILGIDPKELVGHITNNATVNRINSHFSNIKLNLFYVDCHGGNAPRPFFGLGPFTWYSFLKPSDTGIRGIVDFDLSALALPIGYGGNVDPPGLVWIDSCDSAGGTPGGTMDTSFAQSFQTSSLTTAYGVFVGWQGYCVAYQGYLPPADCWNFWRRQFWAEIFVPRNFQTAFNNANSKTTNFTGFSYPDRPNDEAAITGFGASSY